MYTYTWRCPKCMVLVQVKIDKREYEAYINAGTKKKPKRCPRCGARYPLGNPYEKNIGNLRKGGQTSSGP